MRYRSSLICTITKTSTILYCTVPSSSPIPFLQKCRPSWHTIDTLAHFSSDIDIFGELSWLAGQKEECQTCKRQMLASEDKLELLRFVADGKSIRETAARLYVSKSTVQAALKMMDILLKEPESSQSVKKAHCRAKRHQCHSLALAARNGWKIIPNKRTNSERKALETFRKLGIGEQYFAASEPCLRKWKKRNNVNVYTISGETDIVDIEQSA